MYLIFLQILVKLFQKKEIFIGANLSMQFHFKLHFKACLKLCFSLFQQFYSFLKQIMHTTVTQPAITCSKLGIEILEQVVKYVQS